MKHESKKGTNSSDSSKDKQQTDRDEVRKFDTESPPSLIKTANEFYKNGDYRQANFLYNKVLSFNPKNAEVWYNKGLVLERIGRIEEAIECYDKAIFLNPGSDYFHLAKADALYELGMFKIAIESYDKAISITPTLYNLYYKKGLALMRLKKYDEAINSYLKIDPLKKRDAKILNAIGNAYFMKCDYVKSLELYEKSLEIEPHSIVYASNKGKALCYLKRCDDAIILYNQLKEMSPNNTTVLNNLAWTLASNNQNKEALTIINKAYDLDPYDPFILDTKGVIHSNLKEYAEAVSFFRKCLKIDPNHGDTSSRLALIEKVIQTEIESSTKKTPSLESKTTGLNFNSSWLTNKLLGRIQCRLCGKTFKDERELHNHIQADHK